MLAIRPLPVLPRLSAALHAACSQPIANRQVSISREAIRTDHAKSLTIASRKSGSLDVLLFMDKYRKEARHDEKPIILSPYH